MKLKLYIFLLAGLIFSMAGMQPMWAMPVELELDYTFSGPPSPGSSTTPWATATFDYGKDINGDDALNLTMVATNLLVGEFIGQWYFNFDDAIDSTDLFTSIILPIDSPGVGIEGLGIEQNFYKAGGDGYYDMWFDFQKADNDPNRFTNGEQVVVSFSLLELPDLKPEDFEFLSSPTSGKKLLKAEEEIEKVKKEIETAKKKLETETDKKEIEKIEKEIEKLQEKQKTAEESVNNEGLYYSAAHIQGIVANNGDSAWIGDPPARVPESPTMLLVGIGLIGLAGFGRRRLKT